MDCSRAGPGKRLSGPGLLVSRAGSLLRQLFRAPEATPMARRLLRAIVGLLALPPFLLLQAINRLCLALDDRLFPAYRQVAVQRPVFILGAPRTGTTAAHRWLAHDARFTTLSTWECLFAPSVLQRRLVGVAGSIDRRLGAPCTTLLSWLASRALRWLDDIHPVSLQAPEEDYLTLLPTLDCFALVIPFPDCGWLWRLARCDETFAPGERKAFVAQYRRYLQRHLFVHGEDRVLLSKNASFAGMARTLAEAFPDARFLICERDSAALARSQFAALAPGRVLFGLPPVDPVFRDRLLATLAFYLANLHALRGQLPVERWLTLPMAELARDPDGALARVYRDLLDRPLPQELRAALGRTPAGTHRPRTPPSLETLGLTPTELRRRLALDAAAS